MWFWISFILLGLFVYLPIGVIIWGAIASLSAKSSWNNVISTFTAILLGVFAILIHGGLFGWYDTIEKPENIIVTVDDKVKNSFYKYEEKGGKVYLTVSDKNFHASNKSHLIDNGNIHFDVPNKNAKKDRANLKWTIEMDGQTYERDSLPAGTEIHIFSSDFSLKIGETIAKVTAKNNLSEFTKTIVINKLSTESECAKSENAENSLCKQFIAANQADAEKEAAAKAKAAENISTPTYNFETEDLDGSTDTSNCSYIKYGKCWDDVADQAEEDASYDAYFYGDDYNIFTHYRGCENECSDIYDDIYWRVRDNAGNIYNH